MRRGTFFSSPFSLPPPPSPLARRLNFLSSCLIALERSDHEFLERVSAFLIPCRARRAVASGSRGRISALAPVDRTHDNVIKGSDLTSRRLERVSRLANRRTTETIRCGLQFCTSAPVWDLVCEVDVGDRTPLCTRLTNLSPPSCPRIFAIRARNRSEV